MWTQKGKLVLFATVALFVIAMANDSVVVYGLWGVGVGLLGIAFLLARRSLRGLECRRVLETARTTEGGELRVRLQASAARGAVVTGAVVRDTCRNSTTNGVPVVHSFLVERATADRIAVARAEYPCPRRGRYELGPLVAVGGDPFGLFEMRVTFEDRAEGLAYPETFEVPLGPRCPSPLLHLGAVRPLPTRGRGSELYGVREYVPGDDLRRVHWKATAHVGKLSVKELESTAGSALSILLDLSRESCFGEGRDSTTEVAIRAAASIADSSLLAGQHVRLRANSRQSLDIPLERGEAQRHRLLTALAEARPDGHLPLAALVSGDLRRVPVGSTALLITSVPDERLKAGVAAALQRGARMTVVLVHAHSFCQALEVGRPRRARRAREGSDQGGESLLPSFPQADYESWARELAALGARVAVLRHGEDPRQELSRALKLHATLGASPWLAAADVR